MKEIYGISLFTVHVLLSQVFDEMNIILCVSIVYPCSVTVVSFLINYYYIQFFMSYPQISQINSCCSLQVSIACHF